MTKLHPDLEALMPEPFASPDGIVSGPCACGSWPGGACLKCPAVNFYTATQMREAILAATERAAKKTPMISTLFEIPGTLMFKATDGRWFYMNHANTWQSCPPFGPCADAAIKSAATSTGRGEGGEGA